MQEGILKELLNDASTVLLRTICCHLNGIYFSLALPLELGVTVRCYR